MVETVLNGVRNIAKDAEHSLTSLGLGAPQGGLGSFIAAEGPQTGEPSRDDRELV